MRLLCVKIFCEMSGILYLFIDAFNFFRIRMNVEISCIIQTENIRTIVNKKWHVSLIPVVMMAFGVMS
jgi:hypothetical protein